MDDNWSEKLSKLINEELRISALSDIKQTFESLPRSEASAVARRLQLPLIFDCLNASDQEQVELACDVLSMCMSHLSLGDSTERYDVFLERALNHPFPSVKLMVLKEINRVATNDDLLLDLAKRSSLLRLIISSIGDEDLAVAKLASEIIGKIALIDSGIKQLLLPDARGVFEELIGLNEVVRLRVFELFIDVSAKSENVQKLLASAGLFEAMLRELTSNDVLLRINIIELLSRLVTEKYGYMFLESQGYVAKLIGQLDDDSDVVAQQLCEPAILRFFGAMAVARPEEIIRTYSKVIDRIFNNLESDNIAILGVSLDTFGNIASSDKGKFALETSSQYKLERIVPTIANLLGSVPTELKIRILITLEVLLSVENTTNRASNITFKWFKQLGDNFIDKLVSYAKNPFGEIRLAGLSVLLALSSQQWGQEVIQQVPGLIEFLLDRNVETTKECKEIKYEIVKLLSESSVFDQTTLLRLKAFMKEGPFYVRAVTEVAIEGNS